MANLLQSSQTTAQTAPSYYTDYLSNLATSGTDAAKNAQYVGAQPLQQQAFGEVDQGSSAFQPTLTAAGQTLGQAAGAASPISAATPYLQAAGSNLGSGAQALMSPYIQSVVQSIGDIGRRNIMQNLAPQATAAAVGSGQFGSQRGAQVLGQTIEQANQDILQQQSNALNSGYASALQAALAQNQLEGQLGATAGQLQSVGQQNLTQAGQAQGTLAGLNQQLNLARINALSTLGGQQQTIAQNQQLFPLTTLSTLAGLMRQYQMPMTTTQTMNVSPLSALATVGSGLAGLFTPNNAGTTLWDSMSKAIGNIGSGTNANSTNEPSPSNGSIDPNALKDYYNNQTGGALDQMRGSATDDQIPTGISFADPATGINWNAQQGYGQDYGMVNTGPSNSTIDPSTQG